MNRPFRKHIWVGVWEGHNCEYQVCKDCCVRRNDQTEKDWCQNPRDKKYRAFPIVKDNYGYN